MKAITIYQVGSGYVVSPCNDASEVTCNEQSRVAVRLESSYSGKPDVIGILQDYFEPPAKVEAD